MTGMRRRLLLLTLVLASLPLFAGTGRILILNVDAPGVGFNDPTPATPVGGNDGVTLGQQRLNVFERAAYRWQNVLDTNVDVRIRSTFVPLTCDDNGVVLGSAQTLSWDANFPNAPLANTWYPAALANKLAGVDRLPSQEDMLLRFNSALDTPACLGDRSWYYGFDGNEGDDDALYSVVLHEIGHGLGFAGRSTIDFVQGRPSIFDTHTFDLTAGLRWDQMTPPQREISSTNTRNLVWDGANVTRAAATLLQATTLLSVSAPAPIAKDYEIGTASFGPPANRGGLTGRAVPAQDAANTAGPSNTDGCTAFTNAAEVSGNIAVIDRGTCTFVEKALNAQTAGATGVIVVDNRKDTCMPPSLGGNDDLVTIPAISITQDDGALLKGQFAAAEVRASLRLDPSRLAGASQQGFVRLYAPCTFNAGSSVYHFDTTSSPNLLMEPFINADLLDTTDLTTYLLMDIGWTQPARTGRRGLRR